MNGWLIVLVGWLVNESAFSTERGGAEYSCNKLWEGGGGDPVT